jgi:hypothetical protein
MRARLIDGMERIAAIRADIAKTAKAPTLPSVEVVPYLLHVSETDGNHLVHGVARVLRPEKARGDGQFGVQLSAHTATCRDRSAVRTILIHEFCHCFYAATQVVNRFDSIGRHGELFDLASHDAGLAAKSHVYTREVHTNYVEPVTIPKDLAAHIRNLRATLSAGNMK